MPIAVPMMPASASGVSITRSAPNSSYRPEVARNTPPNLPISSPSTTTRGSTFICVRRASRTDSSKFMTGMTASRCYVGRLRVSSAPRSVASPRRGVDSPSVIWILLVVLTILGGVTAVGVASRDRKKLPGGSSAPKQLGTGDKLTERGINEARVDDIITIDSQDYLCEGVINYDEDGHRWVGARCVDNQVTKWLIVGLERTGAHTTRLLEQDRETQITGYPPEALV